MYGNEPVKIQLVKSKESNVYIIQDILCNPENTRFIGKIFKIKNKRNAQQSNSKDSANMHIQQSKTGLVNNEFRYRAIIQLSENGMLNRSFACLNSALDAVGEIVSIRRRIDFFISFHFDGLENFVLEGNSYLKNRRTDYGIRKIRNELKCLAEHLKESTEEWSEMKGFFINYRSLG